MTPIDELRKKRFVFLRRLYELSGGSRLRHFVLWDIGKELGFTNDETESVCEYLSGENLIEYVHLGGGIAITHYGVVEIETALSNPNKPTEYFPAVNFIYVGNMQNSQIQQATIASLQSATQGVDPAAVKSFLTTLETSLPTLMLPSVGLMEAQADIATLRAQLASPTPKFGVIRECLRSVRSVLEGATGNVVGQQLLSQLSSLGI